MEVGIRTYSPLSASQWSDTIAPKEHGSWSLAFEPIALALLVAHSAAGLLFAVALAAVFFARRPLRIAFAEKRVERRDAARLALFALSVIALLAIAGAIVLGGVAWLRWLLPMAFLGGVFVLFDTRGAGREELAEVAGTSAFALAPAAFAALAGWSSLESTAIAVVVAGRSVGSVLCIRAFLRAAKTKMRRDWAALVTASVAVPVTFALVRLGLVPWLALVAMVIFAGRSFALLVIVRPAWRARTAGMVEALMGGLFVIGLAIAWRL